MRFGRRNELTALPVQSITSADVLRFVADEPLEGDTLEFKQDLSTRDGLADRWLSHGDRVGDRARNEILEQIVAFANAHDGMLILGIEESDDHPRRAVGVRPIPKCADLANRLRLAARDVVEPHLAVLELEGIEMRDDGSGVVVIRVGESRVAPHRLKATLECYARRGDRTERMTMREIQDLTLQRAGGMDGLDAIFSDRRRRFADRIEHAMAAAGVNGFSAVRATALPISSLHVSRESLARLTPYHVEFQLGERSRPAVLPGAQFKTRPLVRGRMFFDTYVNSSSIEISVLESGVVEYLYFERPFDLSKYALGLESVVGVFANALATSHALRLRGGSTATEYVVEVELRRESGLPLWLSPLFAMDERRWQASSNQLMLPRYPFGVIEELPVLVGLLVADCANAAGLPCEPNEFPVVGPAPELEAIALGEQLIPR